MTRISLLVFLLVCLLGAIVVVLISRRNKQIQGRLEQIAQSGEAFEAKQAKPVEKLSDAVWRRASPRFEKLALRISPAAYLEHIDLMLTQAGRTDTTAAAFVASQLVTGAAGGMLGFWLGSMGMVNPLMATLLILITLALPYARLRSAVEERQRQIRLQLPNFLDLLSVLTEAGMTLDVAVYHIDRHHPSLLTKYFIEAIQDAQWSQTPRAEHFWRIARKTGLPEVERLVGAIISAELRGTDLSPVLRLQSQELHRERRSNVNRIAQSVAVKLMAPLFLCFLPVLFIIVFVPVFLNFMDFVQ